MSSPVPTDHLSATFYRELDDEATAAAIAAAEAEGIAPRNVARVYRDMCKIQFVADKFNEIHIGANEGAQFMRERNQKQGYFLTPAQMFPRQYERFLAGLAQVADGIPIEELEGRVLSPGKIEQLKQLHIHTVEALAQLEGTKLANLGPNARSYQRQAADYLKVAKAAEADHAFRNALEQRDTLIEQLSARLAALEGGAKPAPITTTGKRKAALDAEQPAPRAAAVETTEQPVDKHGRPLKGALLAAWKRKQAAAAKTAKDGAKKQDKPLPPAEAAARAMTPVDLRAMLTAYGVTLRPGASFDEMVEAFVKANDKAERGLKATDPEPAAA